MFFGKMKDQHEDQKDGFVFLQDNSPKDQQKFAIMVDVGFRSRPKTTAKVHIILHGEDGVSETRELYCPHKPLFERNSRHTFIMSVPESLGPLWKIHIWHNNSGSSPSLYLSHVIVKDLKSGTSWFFYAECWLAIDEGDGKVERELTSVGHGLGFRRLFYCKFTEYLEDFHFWGSIFSQPSYSWFSHTQRITACFVLLLGYMCLNVLLIHWKEEQYTVEIGLIEISTISIKCGLKVALAVYPVIVLLSLLFRLSQKKFTKDSGDNRFKDVKGSPIDNIEGHQHSVSATDTVFESNLTWQHFQYWAYDAWKKKYERDFSASSIHFGNGSRGYQSQCPSVSSQSSSGFEDCSSNNGGKNGRTEFKDCENSSCSQYSPGTKLEAALMPSGAIFASYVTV
ncbi:polycystin-1-like protein 1 [Ranitomeya variabilis]|uniref:polycystin-1-like protein 1 n=1 Tax=Ranitomeya variabilis TaxID=490064 RepID=UPI004056EC98